ncbi:LacI family DNA-binding transcriptional regulator [Isoptericola variabilis]|uniref:Transcriptional regulator, LacI family n=1 Tax=Isoptericola variabilis (strain 225) TaxID=743718 RepID=F6FQ48_ISOV2|nr:LacI family DNA-binding transcriptional regulator [Isoptericola variabilis]AEG44854.1 transcriptional regulator, LacI family [Isoptericola variabilis 225]TWH31622.1 LacI family transcriptional regulator [Isoptericola variabilis J7]
MARKKDKPTMWDVAARAGVSQATVSLVLNDVGGSRVAESTKVRVLTAVEELGYRTNAFARSLRSGDSSLIGFVSDEVASAPFPGKLLKGAQERAWETGHVILSIDTYDRPELEAAAIDTMMSYRVRGVVYASMYHRRVRVPESLRDVPTVVVNAQDAAGIVPSVFPDEEFGGYTATRHLIDAGHRRIAMINIQPRDSDLPAGIGRLAGYRRALDEAGIAFDPSLVRYGNGIVEHGLELTRELMDSTADRPSAIFCGNDRTAWGAYRALESLGLRVPDDCSIVGFDNQETLAPFLDPGLTTVALPFEQMARRAVEIVLGEGGDHPQLHPIECSLVRRGSVASAKVPV